ncbi:tetratricopeptide repeat protein [Hymenobacter gummosus]|uniref:tetratricopeptide repeat protein n=1 Tax=Hymenobacter gummosus TaxID=1776032 RepID=UPI000F88D322|nr:tetratricopeptide repeat protein [Hymenobacter gummosus]
MFLVRAQFDSRVAAATTRWALVVMYRSRFTRNYSSRFIRRALALLHHAAEAGNVSAAGFLGLAYGDAWGVEQDYAQAVHWLQRAADAGHRLACYNLGMCYDNGYGVPQSPAKAFHYYRRAAVLGDSEAMQAVGSFYFRGDGVAQDLTQARKWYRKSARLGHADAMCDLARCYQRGVGGPRNHRLAVCWFQSAIDGGCTRAHTGLGLEYTRPEYQNWSLARHHLELAAEANQAHAMYMLGRWATEKWDGTGNLADARFWFEKAAAQHHEGAILQLAELLGEEF